VTQKKKKKSILKISYFFWQFCLVSEEGVKTMGIVSEEAIDEFQELMDQVEEPLKKTYERVHQGYLRENLGRFLKARDWNVCKAHTMLVECLRWRVDNEIDSILSVS
jgi:hypothetical protein